MLSRYRLQIAAIVVAPLMFLAAGRAGSAWRNWNGYCEATQSYITSKAMIDAGISKLLSRPNAVCARTANTAFSCTRTPKYTGIEQFMATNPNCCKIGLGPEDPRPGPYSIVLRLQGEAAGYVTIAYLVYDDAPNGEVATRRVDEVFSISNCGQARAPW